MFPEDLIMLNMLVAMVMSVYHPFRFMLWIDVVFLKSASLGLHASQSFFPPYDDKGIAYSKFGIASQFLHWKVTLEGTASSFVHFKGLHCITCNPLKGPPTGHFTFGH